MHTFKKNTENVVYSRYSTFNHFTKNSCHRTCEMEAELKHIFVYNLLFLQHVHQLFIGGSVIFSSTSGDLKN